MSKDFAKSKQKEEDDLDWPAVAKKSKIPKLSSSQLGSKTYSDDLCCSDPEINFPEQNHSSNATEDEMENIPMDGDTSVSESDFFCKRFGLSDASKLLATSSTHRTEKLEHCLEGAMENVCRPVILENNTRLLPPLKPLSSQKIVLPPISISSLPHTIIQNIAKDISHNQRLSDTLEMKQNPFPLKNVDHSFNLEKKDEGALCENQKMQQHTLLMTKDWGRKYSDARQAQLEHLHQQWCDKEEVLTQEWQTYYETLIKQMKNEDDEIRREHKSHLEKLHENFRNEEKELNEKLNNRLEQVKADCESKEKSSLKEKKIYFNNLELEWKKEEEALGQDSITKLEHIKAVWQNKEDTLNKEQKVLLEKLEEEWKKRIEEFNLSHKKELADMLQQFSREKSCLEKEYQASLEKMSEDLNMEFSKEEERIRAENSNKLKQLKADTAKEEEVEKDRLKEIQDSQRNELLESFKIEKDTLAKEMQNMLHAIEKERQQLHEKDGII